MCAIGNPYIPALIEPVGSALKLIVYLCWFPKCGLELCGNQLGNKIRLPGSGNISLSISRFFFQQTSTCSPLL